MLSQKDTNLMIMEKLDDRSLLNLCLTDKNAAELCRNEPFWRKRYVTRFGERAVKYKPANRTWKNNYMQTLVDLGRYDYNPTQFLTHIQWSGNPETSAYIPNVSQYNKIPFLEAPEWVRVNFYLLDLRKEYYINGKLEKHVTPEMLFESEVKKLSPGKLVNGYAYAFMDKFPHN